MASLVLAPSSAPESASDSHWTTSTPPAGGETALDEIEQFVRAVVKQLRPGPAAGARPGPGRPRVLPALALWAGLLVCVLRGHGSQRALWRLLSGAGLWDYPRFPVTDQAVRNRLAVGGPDALAQLFRQLSAVLAARLAPCAAEVVALDASALDQLARTLPALRGLPPGDDRRQPGKLAGRVDPRRQQWQLVLQFEAPHKND
jgi:hypothetical protein